MKKCCNGQESLKMFDPYERELDELMHLDWWKFQIFNLDMQKCNGKCLLSTL